MANFPPYYKFNFGFALLGADMNSSTSSMTIQGGSNFPYNVLTYFKVVVWRKTTYANPADDPQAEIMTAVWSGTTNIFTVTRGEEGTTPQSHLTGSAVAAVVTAGLIQSIDTWTPRGATSFNTPGIYNYTLPYWVTKVYLKAWGPGGCGGIGGSFSSGRSSNYIGGGGGGSGGYCEGILDVNGTIQVVVGRRGITSNNNGGNGSVPGTNTVITGLTTTITAFSGTNGTDAQAFQGQPGQGGPGGSTQNALISIPGNSGTTPPQQFNTGLYGIGGISFGSSGGFPGGGGNGGIPNATTNPPQSPTDGFDGLVLLYW